MTITLNLLQQKYFDFHDVSMQTPLVNLHLVL